MRGSQGARVRGLENFKLLQPGVLVSSHQEHGSARAEPAPASSGGRKVTAISHAEMRNYSRC